MPDKLNIYAGTITLKSGHRFMVLSVFGTDEMDAQNNVFDQLKRKGRKRLLRLWVEAGMKVLKR